MLDNISKRLSLLTLLYDNNKFKKEVLLTVSLLLFEIDMGS